MVPFEALAEGEISELHVGRAEVQLPEQQQHAFRVDVAFKTGNQQYALEHTGIDPFEFHMQMEAQAKCLSEHDGHAAARRAAAGPGRDCGRCNQVAQSYAPKGLGKAWSARPRALPKADAAREQ